MTCTKVRHKTRDKAQYALKKSIEHSQSTGYLHVYYCKECSAHHVGHKPRQIRYLQRPLIR